MARFAGRLSSMKVLGLDRPILDLSGFDGEFIYRFTFRPDTVDIYELQAKLKAALAEQLGLRLEARREKIGVMVIDHIERDPASN